VLYEQPQIISAIVKDEINLLTTEEILLPVAAQSPFPLPAIRNNHELS
jgi:hypothetical protein